MTAAAERVMSELAEMGSATVHEAAPDCVSVLHGLSALDPASAVAGPARCVLGTPGDNLAVHHAVAESAPGEVLVVELGGFAGAGHWGEVLTAAAQARGVVGLVINGSVRDARATAARGFPVWHRGLCITSATKSAAPAPPPDELRLGPARVHAGDVVVADRDAVAFVPRAILQDVLGAARDRVRREQRIVAALGQGRTTLDLLGLP